MQFFPSFDFTAEFANREDPFLPPDGMDFGRFAQNKENVAGGHERQLLNGHSGLGEYFSQGLDTGSDSLDRNAGVDQTLGGLEGDEVFKAVSVMSALGSRRGCNKVGLSPVLKLAPGNTQELKNVPSAKEFGGRGSCSKAFCGSGSIVRFDAVLPSGQSGF